MTQEGHHDSSHALARQLRTALSEVLHLSPDHIVLSNNAE